MELTQKRSLPPELVHDVEWEEFEVAIWLNQAHLKTYLHVVGNVKHTSVFQEADHPSRNVPLQFRRIPLNPEYQTLSQSGVV